LIAASLNRNLLAHGGATQAILASLILLSSCFARAESTPATQATSTNTVPASTFPSGAPASAGSAAATSSGPPAALTAAVVLYRPINAKLWADTESLIALGKVASVLKLNSPGAASAAADEWRLVLAKALIKNKQPLQAQVLLMELASRSVGTNQGAYALHLINQIARDAALDEDAMEDLSFDLDAAIDDLDDRLMIAYFQGRALVRKGFSEWGSQAVAILKSSPNSPWSLEMVYDRALQALESGDSIEAYSSFEALKANEHTRQPTRQLAELALARLIFERKDFAASLEAYRGVNLGVRDRAHELAEMAWGYFYDHQYGKALGAIRALKSAYFKPLISPEAIVLEMLIYRELCQYRSLRESVKDFQQTYKPVYTAIEKRKPLEKVPILNQMLLQEGAMQKRATVISEYRSEAAILKSQTWADPSIKSFLMDRGLRRQRTVDQSLQKSLRAQSDRVANWFLDLREQAYFLDYDSSMRLAQMRDTQDPNYIPPEKDEIKVETLFWPVTTEAWIDELADYEVLIHSSCRNTPPGVVR
jgi:hypothetical protein